MISILINIIGCVLCMLGFILMGNSRMEAEPFLAFIFGFIGAIGCIILILN